MAGSKVQSTITIIYTYDQLNLLDDFSSPNKFTLLFFFFLQYFSDCGSYAYIPVLFFSRKTWAGWEEKCQLKLMAWNKRN